MTQPKGISPDPEADPRRYSLGPDDVGCTFKVKCKPIREDGEVGELCTSKNSPKIMLG